MLKEENLTFLFRNKSDLQISNQRIKKKETLYKTEQLHFMFL